MTAKSATTRHFATFALELAIEHDSGSPHDRRRVGVAQCLHDFYLIIASEGQFLSADARERILELGRNLCVMYSQLSAEASHARRKL